jgi:hypothetical protein
MGNYEVFAPFRKFVSGDSLLPGRACHSLTHLASPPSRKLAQTPTLWPIALGQMRYLTTLLLFFVILVDSWAQTDKDVFKQVFIDFVLKDRQSKTGDLPPTTVIILNKPSHDIKVKSKDFEKYRSNYKKLDRLTFEDFVIKCQDDLKFNIDTIDNLQTVIVDKSSFKSVGDLYKLYPNFHLGLIELTNVGFNPTRTQALVYYGYQGGPMTGGGVYIVYIKKRTRWKVAKAIGAWAS